MEIVAIYDDSRLIGEQEWLPLIRGTTALGGDHLLVWDECGLRVVF